MTIALLFCACGSVRHKLDFESERSMDAPIRVEVVEVTNQSGKLFDLAAENMLRDALVKELTERELLWVDTEQPRHLILSAQILDYERGDAFKRWLLPGYGSTVLSVRGDLTDTSDGRLVGSFEARRTVSVGGAYSAGAWQTIFGKVAADVADDLEKKVKESKQEPGA
jgi:hypothetical protein